MDAASALADLVEISAQVESAVVLDGDGTVLAATRVDAERGSRLAQLGTALFDAAATAGSERRTLVQLEAALAAGSVFVVREGDRTLVATTTAAPSSGLVLYDLRACLRQLDPPKPKRRPRKRPQPADA